MAGKAIIFSAPSGSGKTTIVHHLLSQNADLGFSISAATRDKRGRNETNGKDYYFLTPEEFKHKIDNDEFVMGHLGMWKKVQNIRREIQESRCQCSAPTPMPRG